MRILSIEWTNYRQYQNQKITFYKHGSHDLHYFIAENGIGKTTFFNSVNWCLYNDEPYLTDAEKAFSILNKAKKKTMKVDQVATVRVVLTVECSEGTITYSRNAAYRLTEENDATEVLNKLTVTTNFLGKETKVYNEDESTVRWVNNFVPFRLRDYYFFDAESLKDYFSSESNTKVKTAVFQISDIDTLREMKRHLVDISSEYRKEVTSSNPKTAELNSQLEQELALLEEADKEILQLADSIDVAREEIEKNRKIIDGYEDTEEIEKDREKLKGDIHDYEVKLAEQKLEIRSFVKRYTVLFSTYSKIKKLYEKLEEMDANNELPPKITSEFLNEMLTAKKCLVCNRELDLTTTEVIKHLIEQHRSKETLSELNKIKGVLSQLIEETKSYEEKRDKLLEHLVEIEDALDRFSKEKEALDKKYDSIPNPEKLKHAVKMRNQYESECQQATEELGVAKSRKEECDRRIIKIKQDIKNAKSKETAKLKADRSLTLAEKGTEILNDIIENIRDEIRNKISEKTSELFKTMLWKTNTYVYIGLMEDYSISARDADGEEGVGSTSGAEGQLLALSFILGLQSVSGYDSPLLIDTPVARTSGLLRKNFCDVLKQVSKEKQVILFFTKDEFNSNVQDSLVGYESNHYSITLNDEKYVEVK